MRAQVKPPLVFFPNVICRGHPGDDNAVMAPIDSQARKTCSPGHWLPRQRML